MTRLLQLEAIAVERVAEAQESGKYFSEEMAEEEQIDLVDVKDTKEMVQSEHVPAQERATETSEMMSAAKTVTFDTEAANPARCCSQNTAAITAQLTT